MGNPIAVLTAAPAAAPAPSDAAPPGDLQTALGAVLADVLGVGHVPADSDFFQDLGADSMVMARFCARVRKRADLPSISMKDVYRHPTVAGLAAALAPDETPAAAAPAPAEAALAEVLAGVLQVDHVPVDSSFFDDLGADSLVMAQFCARVRKRPDLPSVSMKDVYRHPTVRSLAEAFRAVPSAPAPPAVPAPVAPAPVEAPRPAPAGTALHVLCGVLQALFFCGYCLLVAIIGVAGYDWISAGGGIVDDYLRSVVVGGGTFLGLAALPIAAKWLLVGRWKAGEFPVWGLHYVRFWIVKTLVQKNPLVLVFNGTPLYPLYLRALGAKVGRGVAVFAKTVPVATDLLTIGSGTVLRKDAVVPGYRAHDGRIQLGPVTFGADVVVGESSVIDIGTSMGDGAQLGHRSSLQAGQAVPAGQSWHGTPARRADVDYSLVPPARCSTRRRVTYSVLKLLGLLFVDLPLAIGAVALLVLAVPGLGRLLEAGPMVMTSASFYLDAMVVSLVLYLGGILVGLAVMTTVPRVLGRFVTPGRVYPLYGVHYSLQRTVTRMTSAKYLLKLTGNSFAVVHLLRSLGYDLGRYVQTGSNFGEGVKHDNPYLTSVGAETIVADGLSAMNVEFSSTSFTASQVRIGARSFLGNAIAYPPEARTGDDVLLATKVMVPIDGPVREGVGLLGSPAFEIPRTVLRDATIDDHLQAPGELARRLAAKRRHNLGSMGLFLLLRWANFFGTTLITLAGFELHDRFGAASVAGAMVLSVLFVTAFGIVVERASTGFRPLQPRQCSIYDPYFWWHERFWKLAWQPAFYNGTPLKPVVLRLLGARVGRRVFDDGLGMPERTLVTIGDGCTFNAGSTVQCHSQEDGGFKLDRITIGSGVTVGVAAWVHYGVTIGDGAEIGPDAFLMKGSEVPARTRWAGNPAEEVGEVPAPLPAPSAPLEVADLVPPQRTSAPIPVSAFQR
ncbi:Pls/PosA family non-ribosomal peptide synthetase [Geodermatophilus sp. SYSU D00965]